MSAISSARCTLEAPTARGVAERLLGGALQLQTADDDPRACLGVISMVACTTQGDTIKANILGRQASSHQALIERFRRAEAEGDLKASVDPSALALYLSVVMQGMGVLASGGATRT